MRPFVGMFRVDVRIANPSDPLREETVRAVVDTGAMYPVVPRSVVQALGLPPRERRSFRLANDPVIVRDVAAVLFTCQRHTTVIDAVLGEANDVPLLGALALEGLGLEVDPVRQEVRPMTLYLLPSHPVALPA